MVALHIDSPPIPGPPPVPLLGAYGNLLRFMRGPIPYMLRLHRTFGEVVGLACGIDRYVFAFGPRSNRQVLGNPSLFHALDAKSLPVRIPAGSTLARLYSGLHQMNGAKHEQQRRLMMPALSRGRIAASRDAIVDLTERKLSGWGPGQRRDVLREMRELALAIAVKTRLGLDPDREGKPIRGLLERWMSSIFSPAVLLLPLDLPPLPYHRLLRLSDRLEGEIGALIARKRAGGEDQGDMLSKLIETHDEDGVRMTYEELIGQTTALFVAGHDITARALTWTLFLLSQHPPILSDLLDELGGQLHGAAPRSDQLGDFPLLEAVIKESMRLLPPVTWWSRVSQAPAPLGPYTLPAGARVIVSHAVTHRLPDLYPRPDRFLPERWFGLTPGPYEYIPFSAGPRACPGAASAMMEMKLVLAAVVQRFRLDLPPGSRVDCGGLMLSAPRRGLPMDLGDRDRRCQKTAVSGNIRALVDLD
jgi:cytochrome P450